MTIVLASLRIVTMLHSELCSPELKTAALQSMLFDPSFALSSLRLTLIPNTTFHSLQTSYNLPLDPTSSAEANPAIFTYLHRFHARGWAGHGYRSSEADQQETLTMLDELGSSQGGKCVLEWELRGVEIAKGRASSKTAAASSRPNTVSKNDRGLVGLVRSSANDRFVEVVPLLKVLEMRSSASSNTVSLLEFVYILYAHDPEIGINCRSARNAFQYRSHGRTAES